MYQPTDLTNFAVVDGTCVGHLRIRKRQSPRVEATVQRAKKKVVLQDDKKTAACVEGLKTFVFSSLLHVYE